MALDLSAVGKALPPTTFEYNDREVRLYALGVGATTKGELDFVYEKNLKVLPTFAAIPAFPALAGIGSLLEFNPVMLVHAGQRIDLLSPIPTSGKLTTQGKIANIFDKGNAGALVVIETVTTGEDGSALFKSTSSVLLRGEGNFDGERGPSTAGLNKPPDRDPDFTVELVTSAEQAALYRLSGDRNPLHIDPDFAKQAGFDRPILHGLCTFGFVGLAVLNSVCDGDPARLRSLEVRFSDIVYPGETLMTDIWQEADGLCIVQARSAGSEKAAISNAAATIVS